MHRFLSNAARTGFVVAGLFVLSSAGCSTDEIENRITCADVCNRYQECFDDDYDVSACVDRCEDEATANEQKERRLEACDDCMDNESCVSAVFECGTACGEFVP
jgi:hypothetical protein